MQIEQQHSHKGGHEFISRRHPEELQEVISAIEACDAVACLAKITQESTKLSLLFSPVMFNDSIQKYLHQYGWTEASPKSKKGFKEPRITFGRGQFREMDGIKNKVGVEVQFGKYAFMGYDLFSKMILFKNQNRIECGIEVVVVQSVVKNMSSGVSSFNQIHVDMTNRGEADLDIPCLVLGMGCTENEWKAVEEKRKRFQTDRDAMIASGEVLKPRKGARPGPK